MTTLAATALVLLFAGYDTTGITLGYAAYLLAIHPDAQDKLAEEVDAAFDQNGGGPPGYAAIQDMEYLDMVVHETLRLYSPGQFLIRVCTEDYTVPGYPGLTIKADDEIHINVSGTHMDPRHYPNPERFIPERFSKTEKAKRDP